MPVASSQLWWPKYASRQCQMGGKITPWRQNNPWSRIIAVDYCVCFVLSGWSYLPPELPPLYGSRLVTTRDILHEIWKVEWSVSCLVMLWSLVQNTRQRGSPCTLSLVCWLILLAQVALRPAVPPAAARSPLASLSPVSKLLFPIASLVNL